MKDYDGPAYSKSSQHLESRRFNRDSNQAGKPSYKFTPAIEEKQVTERGHRPVYHHEQPWRDAPKRKTAEQSLQEKLITNEPATEETEYQVPFLERQYLANQQTRFNLRAAEEKMTPVEPAAESEPEWDYDGELRLPDTRRQVNERQGVVPMERHPSRRFEVSDAEGVDVSKERRRPLFEDTPVAGNRSAHVNWADRATNLRQAPATSDVSEVAGEWPQAKHERHLNEVSPRVGMRRHNEPTPALFESEEETRLSAALAAAAESHRFQPKQLPKPYQAPTQSVLETGVTREVLQRLVKSRDSYLLFEE